MNRHFYIAWIFLAFSITGCVNFHQDKSLYQEALAPWEVEQNNQRLNDIDNLIQNGRTYIAKQQTEVINSAHLTSPQQARFYVLYAQILLGSGEAEQAIKTLAQVQPSQLSQADRIKFYQSQAFACSLTGNAFETAKARIALDEFLTKPSERKNNQEVILESLGFLPQASFNAQQIQAMPGLAEWISAAKILASRNQNSAQFNDALTKWRLANPQHPANFYLSTVSKTQESIGTLPDSIALLLPGSGPYADAAKAIKAGFMVAHEHYKNSRDGKPVLYFYDTEKNKPAELYAKAVQSGAKLVVGPLNKDHIKILANSSFQTVPVLALNHIPSLNKANLYQFALSPIDDAAEITKKAAADGHKKALLLMPNNELGKRVGAYISENWFAAHGEVLDKRFYDPTTSNASEAVKKLLMANPANTTADTLFLGASPKEARAINAALNTNANTLSVYALSNIYSGLNDQKNDAALNGVTFCDAPWLFNGAYNGDLTMLAIRDTWNKYPASYLRLIAMGIDAYVLAAKLPTLTTTTYAGATGNLSLVSGNRIKRDLVCAKFVMGRPELNTSSSQPSTMINQPESVNDPIQVIIKGN